MFVPVDAGVKSLRLRPHLSRDGGPGQAALTLVPFDRRKHHGWIETTPRHHCILAQPGVVVDSY
jgi:hypothetical protein